MKNRLLILSLAITTVIFISSPAFCATVARYNSPPHGWDSPAAMATDSSGNVYVTGSNDGGSNNSDYATVAYDATGKQLWVRRYNGPANGDDYARAIAIDASGNVYVTGYSDGEGTDYDPDYDYSTVAYDSSGNQLWVQRYNGPANGDDHASAITTDALGNVYVTGDSESSYGNSDYVTVAYASSGNQLWVETYSVSYWDVATAITTDASGNIYVTGWIYSQGTGEDYATVAYNANGNALWVKRYHVGDGRATAITTDSSGKIFVTGSGEGNYVTVAYDASGNELWVGRYNSPANGYEQATAIATDSSGNVYVTGLSDGIGTNYDYATVAYDASGKELWVARYDSPENDYEQATAITTDSSGNVYVTGGPRDRTSGDYTIVAYDSSGNQLWVRTYNGPANGLDGATAISIGSTGNVYVTGGSEGIGTGFDFATLAYDSNGTQLWVKRYNGPASADDAAQAITTHSSGNVYVTGESGTIAYDGNLNRLWVRSDDGGKGRAIVTDSAGNVYVTGDDDEISYGTVTAAYNSRGTRLWIRVYEKYDGDTPLVIDTTAIAADSSGNVYVTGSSFWPCNHCGGENYITIAYNSKGTLLWVRGYGNPAAAYWHHGATAIATDASGNVYVTGYSTRSDRFQDRDFATVAYNSRGNTLWVRRYNGPANENDRATAIATDASGNIYVTGVSYSGSATGFDYITVAYNSRGTQLWVKRYNGPGNGPECANAIATDSAGRLYVTGYSYGGSSKGYDYATVAYNTKGKQLWVRRYNGPANRYDEAHAIAVDAAGRVYVTGQSLESGTGDDYTTIAYNSSGKQLWVKRYNGPANGADIPQAMAIGLSGHVYVTGQSLGNDTGYDYATVKY